MYGANTKDMTQRQYNHCPNTIMSEPTIVTVNTFECDAKKAEESDKANDNQPSASK